MKIEITDAVAVQDLDILTEFSVSSALPPAQIDAALRADGLGYADDVHAWIIAAVLEQRGAAMSAQPDWVEKFRDMVAFARFRGWWDEATSAMRAHIEQP